jgi:signal transduction histidine kinase
MLKAPSDFVIIFIVISVMLILALVVFIIVIIYRYQQKQNAYFRDIETLKASHENTLLLSQLEIQEQTFQTISREIHDNIGQKLSLAKLHLIKLDLADSAIAHQQLNNSIHIIGEAIKELTNLSHILSGESILNNGLIEALKYEQIQLKKTGLYKTFFSVTGNTVYLNNNTELLLFRIVQEVLNNIVKHAAASTIDIQLHYSNDCLTIVIQDNGKGFNVTEKYTGSGLLNIKKRTALLNGTIAINSIKPTGTSVKVKIPIYENK